MSRPNLTQSVLVCGGCSHWQLDVHPRAISDAGGQNAAAMLVADVLNDHVHGDPCPGGAEPTSVKVPGTDQWARPPAMSDGKAATGLAIGMPLPRWWVWR